MAKYLSMPKRGDFVYLTHKAATEQITIACVKQIHSGITVIDAFGRTLRLSRCQIALTEEEAITKAAKLLAKRKLNLVKKINQIEKLELDLTSTQPHRPIINHSIIS